MSRQDAHEISPPRGNKNLDERLDDIERKMDELLEAIAKGTTRFAVQGIRLLALEAIVYGAVAIGLTVLATQIVGSVVRSGSAP